MGTWSSRPFGNDAARDWLLGLKGPEGADLLQSTIAAVLEGDAPLAADISEECLAAAAILASAAADPIRAVPAEAKAWIREHAYVPRRELLIGAVDALRRVKERSELRELWDESGPESWLKQVEAVLGRLERAQTSAPVERSPTMPGMPRSLYKMIERAGAESDPKLMKRIRQKLTSLEDVNAYDRSTNFNTPLALVSEAGLLEEVRFLLDERMADPDGHNPSFRTALGYACRGGFIDIAELLVSHGAAVVQQVLVDSETRSRTWFPDDDPGVPFEYSPAQIDAIRGDSPSAMEFVLGRGADLAWTDLNGDTLLHKAAGCGATRVLQYLINLGLDVNSAKPHSGETPLHYAAKRHQLEAVEILLENGADPNLVESFNGESALDSVASPKSPLARLIREHGGTSAKDLD